MYTETQKHRKTETQKDRKTETQKDRNTETQKDRRTQNFFLLYRVLVVLKRRENTKKVGVKKFFFRHDSNTGRIPFEPRKILLLVLSYVCCCMLSRAFLRDIKFKWE